MAAFAKQEGTVATETKRDKDNNDVEPAFKGTRTRVPVTAISVVRKSSERLFRNHRLTFTTESIQELARDIREHGLLEPIIVRANDKGGFDLVAGERRFRAINSLIDEDAKCLNLLAGKWESAKEAYREVDALLVECNSDLEMLEISLAENMHTHPVSDFDLMVFCAELAKEYPRHVVCRLLGKSPSYLSTMLDLAKFPPEILDMFKDGQLTRRACINLLKVKEDRLLDAIRLGGELVKREAARSAAAAAAELELIEEEKRREAEFQETGSNLAQAIAAETTKKRHGPNEKDLEEPRQSPPQKNRAKKEKAARNRLQAAEEKGLTGSICGEDITRVVQEQPDLLKKTRVPDAWTPKRIREAADLLEAAIGSAGGSDIRHPTTGAIIPINQANAVLRAYRQVLGRGPVSPFDIAIGTGEKEA